MAQPNMKKSIFLNLFIYLILSICIISCKQPNEVAPQFGQLKFGINKIVNKGGRVNDTSSPTSILLNITDASGNAIETDKKLPLYLFGNSYISESIQLKPNDYKITKFLVIDANNNIIYASPLVGSPQANYVNTPLPLAFSISENGSTQISPQVLAINKDTTPESLGYVSFGFEVINTSNSIVDSVHFDDGYLSNTWFMFHYSNKNQIQKVTAIQQGYPDFNKWTPHFDEVRQYDMKNRISSVSLLSSDPARKIIKNYTYDTNDKLKDTKVDLSDTYNPFYQDKMTIEEYNGSLPKQILIESDSYKWRCTLEFDENQNLVKKTITNALTNQVLRIHNIKFDNKHNPFQGLFEISNLMWRTEGRYSFDDLTFYYSKNNPILIEETNFVFSGGNITYQITYDSKDRPVKINTGVLDINIRYRKN
jgi:hypothetical protein